MKTSSWSPTAIPAKASSGSPTSPKLYALIAFTIKSEIGDIGNVKTKDTSVAHANPGRLGFFYWKQTPGFSKVDSGKLCNGRDY